MRCFLTLVAATLLCGMSGCSMCDNSMDCGYSFHGGTWQRGDPCCGRVGSSFAPAEGQIVQPREAPEVMDSDAPPALSEGDSVLGGTSEDIPAPESPAGEAAPELPFDFDFPPAAEKTPAKPKTAEPATPPTDPSLAKPPKTDAAKPKAKRDASDPLNIFPPGDVPLPADLPSELPADADAALKDLLDKLPPPDIKTDALDSLIIPPSTNR